MYRDFQWLAVCPVALANGLVIKHDKNVCSTKPIGFTYMLHHTWTTLVPHMVRGSGRWLYGKYCNKILWIILEDLYLTHSNNTIVKRTHAIIKQNIIVAVSHDHSKNNKI